MKKLALLFFVVVTIIQTCHFVFNLAKDFFITDVVRPVNLNAGIFIKPGVDWGDQERLLQIGLVLSIITIGIVFVSKLSR